MLHDLIEPQTVPNGLGAVAISVISELVETIVQHLQGLIGPKQVKDPLAYLAGEIIGANIELF